MKLLLTSGGISNESIRNTLVELLGKPISEASALFVPTAIYPFLGGGVRALDAANGRTTNPLCDLGWQSLGLLELTALPSIRRENWVPTLEETDALLVWGGNVLYLRHWMEQSGLAELLPRLDRLVYVGVSAGSIVTTSYNCDAESNVQVVPPDSVMVNDSERALGYTDFALCVHLDNPNPIFEDHTLERIKPWASQLTVPTYAIDDQSAVVVTGNEVSVVSEGHWHLLTPRADG